jgi:SPP1 family predicted phage head-tail adaptor
MLRAGELRHLVELQEKQPTGGRDEYGQPAHKWVTRVKCWCAIEQLTANEQLVANQQNAQATHRLRTRYSKAVEPTTTWRIKHGDRLLFIAGINNVNELNEEWQFICGELKDA